MIKPVKEPGREEGKNFISTDIIKGRGKSWLLLQLTPKYTCFSYLLESLGSCIAFCL